MFTANAPSDTQILLFITNATGDFENTLSEIFIAKNKLFTVTNNTSFLQHSETTSAFWSL